MNWFAKKIERRDAKAQRNKIREGKGHGAKSDFSVTLDYKSSVT